MAVQSNTMSPGNVEASVILEGNPIQIDTN
jgi:hypothetical protein